MTALKVLEDNNHIEHVEFNSLINMIYSSLLIKTINVDSSYILKQERLIQHFSLFLEQFIELDFIDSKQSKLEFINLIDKLNMQKELLEIESGLTNLDDIKNTAKRFGKKAQSAFGKIDK